MQFIKLGAGQREMCRSRAGFLADDIYYSARIYNTRIYTLLCWRVKWTSSSTWQRRAIYIIVCIMGPNCGHQVVIIRVCAIKHLFIACIFSTQTRVINSLFNNTPRTWSDLVCSSHRVHKCIICSLCSSKESGGQRDWSSLIERSSESTCAKQLLRFIWNERKWREEQMNINVVYSF